MTALLALPILLPLVGAGCSMIVGRSRAAQRAVSLTVLTAVVGVAVTLLVAVDRDGPVAVQAGGWAVPMGITLVADRLSALMLAVASVMLLAVLVYAIGQPGAERNHVGFQSVYLVLSAGVAGAFLTGDLFNLFVSFEMMLAASYVLITLGARRDQVRAGMTYVVISLIASTLFVTALAFVYSATGTVNLALAGAQHGVFSAPAGGVRHQGGAVPALLLAARQLSDSPFSRHRRVRRTADKGRGLRDHSESVAVVPA